MEVARCEQCEHLTLASTARAAGRRRRWSGVERRCNGRKVGDRTSPVVGRTMNSGGECTDRSQPDQFPGNGSQVGRRDGRERVEHTLLSFIFSLSRVCVRVSSSPSEDTVHVTRRVFALVDDITGVRLCNHVHMDKMRRRW